MTVRALRVAVLARAVYPLHGVGGLERHVHDLVRYLALSGVEVTLVTPPGHGEAGRVLRESARIEHVPYVTFPFAGRRGTTILDRVTAYPLFGKRAGRRAAALVAAGEVDLVHALGASGLGYARARRRGAVAPLVFNPQGLEEFGATDPARAGLKRLAYRPLQNALREMAAAADRVLATDRVLEPIVRQHLGTPADRVRVIPNALDLAHIDAVRGGPPPGLLRAGVGATPADFVLLSVGRIEENKGLHVLARALGAADLPACRWVVVGDGPYRGRLQRTCQAVGLGERVSFAGRLPDADLHAWYEAADLFVHPTLYEGSSLVSLEAMAHRRALVATRAGGLPDKVVPGVNGWLVEPGDAGALAGAIREARSDRVRLARMGAEGRRLVEREFSWDVVIRKLRDVYDELTNDD